VEEVEEVEEEELAEVEEVEDEEDLESVLTVVLESPLLCSLSAPPPLAAGAPLTFGAEFCDCAWVCVCPSPGEADRTLGNQLNGPNTSVSATSVLTPVYNQARRRAALKSVEQRLCMGCITGPDRC
jgi:hypothetical protein